MAMYRMTVTETHTYDIVVEAEQLEGAYEEAECMARSKRDKPEPDYEVEFGEIVGG